jgi:Na+-transporting NADH:ubiquinone oxidoreductase subunit F
LEKIERKVTLFFGAKKPEDLFFNDELRAFEKSIPGFVFVPTLSRVTDEDRWEGEKGRVTDLIQKRIKENTPLDVYICGSPPMVESCVDLLMKKGIEEDRIFFDKFE